MSRRTEHTTVYANPSGTFTTEEHVVPIRVRKNGALVEADPTLVRGGDGTVRPKAASVGLEFSGGGKGPMTTITRDGRSMALSWKGELPEPSLDGDTATYAEVLPDVDLKLRAAVTGFQQLLVVKSRKAAESSELRTLRFALDAQGVQVRADRDGNLKAVNPAGQEVFTAPTPTMWDSSGVRAGAPVRVARSADSRASRAAAPAETAAEEGGFVPALGAKEAPMDVAVGDGSLRLTPDKDLLTSPETTFPVYIDPHVSGARQNWTTVAKNYPGTSFWNKSDNIARTGYESETGGTWRSFFSMDARNLWSTDKQIVKSTFRIKNTHSWSCTKKPVELWDTGTINSTTTWNKQPSWSKKLSTVTDAKGWAGSCPAGNLEFDNTANAQEAAKKKWKTMTLGLRASESDVYGWKKFDAKTAVVSTEYNTPPSAPTGYGTSPATQCAAEAPYSAVGNTDVQLHAKITDPDGGTVRARFIMWPTGGGSMVFDETVAVSSGSIARVTVPKSKFKDRTAYSWQVRAEDGKAVTAWTPNPPCRFTVYKDRPSTPPGVSSKEYPDGEGGWPVNTSPVRTPGTFTLTNGGAKDIVAYEYWSTLDETVRTLKPGSPGGPVTVNLTPVRTGPHYLYARTLDRAGNRSDAHAYLFYANGPKTPDKPGDINGDGHADLWAVDADGTLQRHFGDGTGKLTKADRPASVTGYYKNSLITHGGDWTDDGYEDLLELRPDDTEKRRRLWINPNNGFGYACVECEAGAEDDRRELNVWDPGNDHWQDADQILAIGDVDGPLDLDGDGVIGPDDRPGHPDLLVKKGDQLWLYFGSASGYLDEYLDQPPVLLGDDGWSDFDLVAPGDVTGNKRVDLMARQKSTGDLFVYEGTGPNGEGLGAGEHRTKAGWAWTPTSRPLITAAPDATGNGKPDIWATNDNGDLLFYADFRPDGSDKPVTVGGGLKGYRSLG
ncbi:VCBS repeat-containing protein [Streptomyces gamaensis]|uniref:VCBS repeat-containing protein n=1 Tax=Streptomyces gamaensis TaxID=1763542 RepID=A0ABW0ZE32_9ACTN